MASRASGGSDEYLLSFSDDSVPGAAAAAAAECAPYEVPKMEAGVHYAGVGPRGAGPGSFIGPLTTGSRSPGAGPEAYARLVRAVAVPDGHEFGRGGLWDAVRD